MAEELIITVVPGKRPVRAEYTMGGPGKGEEGLDIRTWYTPGDGDDGALARTRQGVRIPPERVPALQEAITKLMAEKAKTGTKKSKKKKKKRKSKKAA